MASTRTKTALSATPLTSLRTKCSFWARAKAWASPMMMEAVQVVVQVLRTHARRPAARQRPAPHQPRPHKVTKAALTTLTTTFRFKAKGRLGET